MTEPPPKLECPEYFIRGQVGYVYSVVANAILWPLSNLAAKVNE